MGINRRKSIGLIGLGSIAVTQTAFSQGSITTSEGFIESFRIRWDNNRTYTIEILEAMPKSKFEFQPSDEMMSFSKLFTHIGFGLDKFAGIIDGKIPNEEPESSAKKITSEYLNRCFEHFESAYKSLDKNDIYAKNHFYSDKEYWKDLTVFDINMLAYNHTIHHRAQATTYLRLNGISPPKYRF